MNEALLESALVGLRFYLLRSLCGAGTAGDICRRKTPPARVFPFSDEIFNSATLRKSAKRSAGGGGEVSGEEKRKKSEKERDRGETEDGRRGS